MDRLLEYKFTIWVRNVGLVNFRAKIAIAGGYLLNQLLCCLRVGWNSH